MYIAFIVCFLALWNVKTLSTLKNSLSMFSHPSSTKSAAWSETYDALPNLLV